MKPETDMAVIKCGNCHTPMPRELRFCRNCGFRLGEGVAEYTETVRFQNAPPGTLTGNSSPPAGPLAAYPAAPIKKRRRRFSGMTWMFIGLVIFFVVAAGFTAIVRQTRQGTRPPFTIAASRSWVGVNNFDTADGGVTFRYVEVPGGPADLAGLVGGDIITSFDGKVVKDDDEIMDLLRNTPIGKTVDVVFIRDGEAKTTKLTTASEAEIKHLEREFSDRPSGQGRFGFDDDETETVPIPGTKISGVKLNHIDPSLPADMAGIKSGDIVIEFDGVPIRTAGELVYRVRRAIPYEPVMVVVMRNGERLEIPVRMGRR